jgi:hypothetical protein
MGSYIGGSKHDSLVDSVFTYVPVYFLSHFSASDFMIRDRIGIETHDMTFEQLKQYVDQKSTLHQKQILQKKR